MTVESIKFKDLLVGEPFFYLGRFWFKVSRSEADPWKGDASMRETISPDKEVEHQVTILEGKPLGMGSGVQGRWNNGL